jgi:signal transduction histidine kinase
LAHALEAMVERVAKPRDCRVQFRGNTVCRPASRAAADQLFRIAQEALTNALKHSRGRRIEVSLRLLRGRMVLRVADDGVGFDWNRQTDSMGIDTMRYRASLIKASFSIAANDGGGTVVACTLDDKQVV